jgi:hydroxymethylpyrimidine pyrophosphatase-like HAD family hydrolase
VIGELREIEDLPIVFQNGALITIGFTPKVLRMIHLRGEVALAVYEISKELNLTYVLYTDFFSSKDMVMEKPYGGSGFEDYFSSSSYRIVYDNPRKYVSEEVAQVAVVVPVSLESVFLKSLKESVSDKGAYSLVKTRVSDGEIFYEVFGPGVGKGRALSFLCNYFGVSPEEVMFVGDNYNDVSLFERVGYPVVMGNAPKDVKQMGTVAPSNDECGVLWAVENVALGEKFSQG